MAWAYFAWIASFSLCLFSSRHVTGEGLHVARVTLYLLQAERGWEGNGSPTAPDARVHSGWKWRDCVPGDMMRRWAGNFAGWHSYLYCTVVEE